MRLLSSAFNEGEIIPQKYTSDEEDTSPPLEWTDVPEGAKALVLICDDPDAPRGTWHHWILFNLPPSMTELPESAIDLSPAVRVGKNSWSRLDYGGPNPPDGMHRYFFALYALDTDLDLPDGASKKDIQAAMEGHIIDDAQLMGRYVKFGS